MTAKDSQEINETLAALGVPPLVASATPISVVFEQNPITEDAPSEPILILSDTKDGNPEPPATHEENTLPETVV